MRLRPELELHGFTLSPVVGTPQGVAVLSDGIRVNEPDAAQDDGTPPHVDRFVTPGAPGDGVDASDLIKD